MAQRGLDPKMIVKIHDIVERNFSKMFARLDARLANQAKKVKVEEVGFSDQFVELDAEPTEQLEVVTEDIHNLVEARIEVGFHDHLVESDMETTKHLVVNDPVAVGGELCIAEHGLACIDGDVHVGTNVDFFVANVGFVATGVDSLVTDVN